MVPVNFAAAMAAFRSFTAAASLKQPRRGDPCLTPRALPQLHRCGFVEASWIVRTMRPVLNLPQLHRCGFVEAR